MRIFWTYWTNYCINIKCYSLLKHGIQEVSGSIPLISTMKMANSLRKHLKWKHFGCFSVHATHSLPGRFVTACHIWRWLSGTPNFRLKYPARSGTDSGQNWILHSICSPGKPLPSGSCKRSDLYYLLRYGQYRHFLPLGVQSFLYSFLVLGSHGGALLRKCNNPL